MLYSLAACDSGLPRDLPSEDGGAAPVQQTDETPVNMPPVIEALPVKATPGETLRGSIEASDPDGEVVGITWVKAPPGMVRSEEGELGEFEWTPGVAGYWVGEVVATDDDGATETAEIEFLARYRANPHYLVAIGDSVASGFGLQRRDFLFGDPCWRAPDAAYPGLVMERLLDAGALPDSDTRVVLAACVGTRVADLWGDAVHRPDGAPDGFEDEGWSQMEWVIRTNPGFVTVTVGANDLGVVDLSWLSVSDSGGEINQVELSRRSASMRGTLGRLLERLVEETDAAVVLTTYYNPVADVPKGLTGCEGECFADLAGEVLGVLNQAIVEEAASFAPRVQVAEIAEVFTGHSAGDSFGPDWARGPIERLLGIQVSAYCSERSAEDDDATWISTLDCIHPNKEGMRAIASVVADVFIEGLAD